MPLEDVLPNETFLSSELPDRQSNKLGMDNWTPEATGRKISAQRPASSSIITKIFRDAETFC